MKKILLLLVSLGIIILSSCSEKSPVKPEGNIKVQLFIADSIFDEASQSTIYKPIPFAKVTMYSQTYNETYTSSTGPDGMVAFENVISAIYEVSIVDTIDNSTSYPTVVSATLTIDLSNYTDSLFSDTLLVKPVSISPIVINEIFYAGSPGHYVFDQFIELYNPTTETQYLDGLILATSYSRDDNTFGSYFKALYTYQFPGTYGGTQYPIEPGQFVVIAHDAKNHADSLNSAPLNLENADWEFFTEYDSRPDYDNPNVPNVNNINPNKDNDFFMNLVSGAVILAVPSQQSTTPDADGYIYIPYTDIIDGVEYHSSSITPDSKIISEDIDAGYGGFGVTRYEQIAIERKQPGFDTNNSSFDFEKTSPTPGSHHTGPNI